MFLEKHKAMLQKQYLADKKPVKIQMIYSLFYYFMQALRFVFDFLQFVQAA